MELTRYQSTAKAIQEIKENYGELTVAHGDKEGYEVLRVALKDLLKCRQGIEAKKKELKIKPRQEIKEIDDEANRINAELAPIEQRLKKMKKAIDDETKRLREEKKEKERKRVSEIQRRLKEITGVCNDMILADSGDLSCAISNMESLEVTEELFEEFIDAAEMAKEQALIGLQALYKKAVDSEAKAAELAALKENAAKEFESVSEQVALDAAEVGFGVARYSDEGLERVAPETVYQEPEPETSQPSNDGMVEAQPKESVTDTAEQKKATRLWLKRIIGAVKSMPEEIDGRSLQGDIFTAVSRFAIDKEL